MCLRRLPSQHREVSIFFSPNGRLKTGQTQKTFVLFFLCQNLYFVIKSLLCSQVCFFSILVFWLFFFQFILTVLGTSFGSDIFVIFKK